MYERVQKINRQFPLKNNAPNVIENSKKSNSNSQKCKIQIQKTENNLSKSSWKLATHRSNSTNHFHRSHHHQAKLQLQFHRWINAIESGKLMTARQRAMYEKTSSENRNVSPIKSRRSQAITTTMNPNSSTMTKPKDLEREKEKTIERLFKKKYSKMVKSTKSRVVKQLTPMISYKNTADLITPSFPVDFEFPIKSLSQLSH